MYVPNSDMDAELGVLGEIGSESANTRTKRLATTAPSPAAGTRVVQTSQGMVAAGSPVVVTPAARPASTGFLSALTGVKAASLLVPTASSSGGRMVQTAGGMRAETPEETRAREAKLAAIAAARTPAQAATIAAKQAAGKAAQRVRIAAGLTESQVASRPDIQAAMAQAAAAVPGVPAGYLTKEVIASSARTIGAAAATRAAQVGGMVARTGADAMGDVVTRAIAQVGKDFSPVLSELHQAVQERKIARAMSAQAKAERLEKFIRESLLAIASSMPLGSPARIRLSELARM